MRVILVNPSFPVTFWSFSYAVPFIGKKAAFPPLGLLTVAALLPSHWNKRLVDLNVEAISDHDLATADLVFLGGMAVQRESAEHVIKRCHALGRTVVAGGPLFSCEPEAFADVDHLVLDEAELTLPAFIRDYEDGIAKKVYRANEFCDLTQTPLPAWELVQTNRYASMSIQFSRGCPFSCDFCNVTTLFGRSPRLKTTQQVIAELDVICSSPHTSAIFFVDDNFIGNKAFLKKELLPAIIEWRRSNKRCIFCTEASINLADDEQLMELMVAAGFDSVFVGIESPEDASLVECRKDQNRNRDLHKSIARIQEAGMQVMGGFIVGFDNDTPGVFHRQIEFIQKSGIVTAMVGLLQAPPGTRLFQRLQAEKRLLPLFHGNNVNCTTNIIPKMGMETLADGYRMIMRNIYSPKIYYQRIRILLRRLSYASAQMPLTYQRSMAMIRSAFWLGLLGRERLQFWLLLAWTLAVRPRHFPLAVTLAIYGYHYRRVCEQHVL